MKEMEKIITLALAGALTLAFVMQPVEASGTIYIREYGTVDPPTAPIWTADGITYTFTDNINDEIVVERSNITIDGNGYILEGDGGGNGFYLFDMDHVVIQNAKITNFFAAVRLKQSSFISILGNTMVDNNWFGVLVDEGSCNNTISGNIIANVNARLWGGISLDNLSNNNTVSGNIITSGTVCTPSKCVGCANGIFLHLSTGNTVFENSITGPSTALYVARASNNQFYHNNLRGLHWQFLDYCWGEECGVSVNTWDDGYPSGGNYWSDYEERYPDANELDDSGIWDTPYVIDGNNADGYPLMDPCGGDWPSYTLIITTSYGGTVYPDPNTYAHEAGSLVDVNAVPNAHYLLDHWELDGDNVGSAYPYTVLIDDDHTLHAVFVPAASEYDLTITAASGGTTEPVPGVYTYATGSVVDVNAIAEPNYSFYRWELDGSPNQANPISVVMDFNHTLQPVFAVGVRPPTLPGQNELNVPADTNVSVTFDVNMDESTINASSFIADARSTGLHRGTITYDSPTKTATLNPLEDFDQGEAVTAILTPDIQSSEGNPLSSYTWSFTIEANDGPGVFARDADYPVGNAPRSVCAADLDGDGDIDLVVAIAEYWSSAVYVLLNHGDGTFAEPSVYPVGGDCPWSVFAADLDGDGDIDLATANDCSDDASILVNKGDGTFEFSTRVYPVGEEPRSVFAADLNGDGNLDIVTANKVSNSVSVLLGIGSGLFPDPSSDYPVGSRPRSVVAADLNGDGKLDLVTANMDSDNVSVLLNNADGSFGGHVTYPVGDGPYSVVAADLDGDGDLDLTTANRWEHNVSVLSNNGDGTFAAHSVYPAGDQIIPLCAADLDGDGDLDLAATSSLGACVLLNDGDGTFGDPLLYPSAFGPWSVCAADLDGDGDVDLATANLMSDSVSVLLNQIVHDVAVTNVVPSETVVYPCDSVSISVTVENQGNVTETFDVTAYYDDTAIETKTAADLPFGEQTTIAFTWEPIDVLPGDYTIEAYAHALPEEADIADNNLVDGTITIPPPNPDVNDDGYVDWYDLAIVADNWLGSGCHTPGNIYKNDEIVNLLDYAVLGAGWTGDDREPPTVPTGLTVTNKTYRLVSLSWTASTDNRGVAGYKVYRDGSYVDSTGYPMFEDTGLLPDTTYTYRVSAYDAANNESAQSGSVSETTDFGPCNCDQLDFDLNDDGIVSTTDFMIFVQCALMGNCPPGTDYNCDGTVGEADANILADILQCIGPPYIGTLEQAEACCWQLMPQ